MPLLSPLERYLTSVPDPRGGPEYPEIYPNPFESEPRPMSDIGTPLTVAPPTLHHHHLPQHVPAAELGATARRADNALGLVFPPFQMHADGASAVVTSAPQAESLRAPSNHQDIRSREHTNQKCYSPRGQATPQSHVTANEALVAGCLQDTRLGGAMSNVSGSEVREQEKLFSPSLIREHRSPRRCSRLVRKPTHTKGRPKHGRTTGQKIG